MQSKSKILIWDWPIRVFHAFFAITITGALGFAFLGEHTSVFEWHMLLGVCAGLLLLMRLILGFVGTRPSRFGTMISALVQLPAYLKDMFGKDLKCYAGHNPIAWLVYLMMFVSLFLSVFTGVNMIYEWAEEIHSVFAWMLLVSIVLHLAGIAIHTIRYKETVALSMLHGKRFVDEAIKPAASRPWLALVLVVVFLIFAGQLVQNYQSGAEQVTIPWIGKTISLEEEGGESEEHEHSDRKHREKEAHDDEHDHHGRHSDD